MNITPVNTINCTPVKQNNKNNKIAFGSVIPVSIKIDGKMLPQSVENNDLFKSLCKRFSINLNKGKGIFADLQKTFQKTDKDFNGKIYSIRGSSRNALWGRRKFFITGKDIDTVGNAGQNIGRENHSQTSKSIYSDNEYKLAKDHNKRIPNIKNFTIEVKTREVHKEDGTTEIEYDIIGGYFTPKKQIQTIQEATKQQPQIKEVVKPEPTKPITPVEQTEIKPQIETKNIKKEEQYQPEFDFAQEIDAENAKKIRKENAIRAIRGY